MVWSSRHNGAESPNGLYRSIEVMRFQPLPARIANKDQKLDWIDPVGTHETAEATHHIDLRVPSHCLSSSSSFGLAAAHGLCRVSPLGDARVKFVADIDHFERRRDQAQVPLYLIDRPVGILPAVEQIVTNPANKAEYVVFVRFSIATWVILPVETALPDDLPSWRLVNSALK